VIVAVIDSGTDCEHPELQGKCVSPYNAISNVPDATPPTVAEDFMAGHGTSVAGLVAAPVDSVGMVGVCRRAGSRLSGSSSPCVPDRRDDAASVQARVDAGAAVINNSWGPAGSGDVFIPASSGELEGLQYAASGRNGLAHSSYMPLATRAGIRLPGPAQDRLAPRHGHRGQHQVDKRSVFSNFGLEIDVAAPSNDVFLSPVYISLEVVGRGDLDQDYTNTFGGTSRQRRWSAARPA